MTDTNNTTDNYELLVDQYEEGVNNLSTGGDVSQWLEARSRIEQGWDSLTDAQKRRVSRADDKLTKNAEKAAAVAAGGRSLPSLRAETPRPASEWWWYLDVIGGMPGTEPSGTSRLLNWGFTAIQVIVLLVAVYLLAQNSGIIPRPATPTRTPPPTRTLAPTATVDTAAFDLSAASMYTSTDNVISVLLPGGGWAVDDANAQNTPRVYTLSLGSGLDEVATLRVLIGEPAALYRGIGLTGEQGTPREALEAFIQTVPPTEGWTFTEITDSTIGELAAQQLGFSIPADPQSGLPGSEVDLRVAENGENGLVMTIVQAQEPRWAEVQPVVNGMIDSIILNLGAIPTATATPTLHPLEITATAVQDLILSLTPAPTGTPLPDATAEATGEAASETESAATESAPEGTAEATESF